MNEYNKVIWALTLWREARGQNYEQKLAIAFVIRNRMKDWRARWGRSASRVCLQPKQFSCYNAGDPNALLFPKENDPKFLDCIKAVEEASREESLDITFGANHYHHLTQDPKWAKNGQLTVVLGKGRFYRL